MAPDSEAGLGSRRAHRMSYIEKPKKATKQATLFSFNYTMSVPLGKHGGVR